MTPAQITEEQRAAEALSAWGSDGDARIPEDIDQVALAAAYLRETADFNRSWVDGRLGPRPGDTKSYQERRTAWANYLDRWADAASAAEARGYARGVEEAAKECDRRAGWANGSCDPGVAYRNAARAIRALSPSPAQKEEQPMRKHTYRPIEEAPTDGTPIIGVCGGVEMAVAYDDGAPVPDLGGWFYWDEDEGGTTYQRAKPQPTEWRRLF